MDQPWKQGSTGGCQETGRGGYIASLVKNRLRGAIFALCAISKGYGLTLKDLNA